MTAFGGRSRVGRANGFPGASTSELTRWTTRKWLQGSGRNAESAPSLKRLSTRSLTAKQMWAVIAGIVIYHELACADGELLSEGYDRGLEKHAVLIYGITAITVGHLLNLLPPKADPYRWIYLIYQLITKGSK